MHQTSIEKNSFSAPNFYRFAKVTGLLGTGVLIAVGVQIGSHEISPIKAYNDSLTESGGCLEDTIYDTHKGAQVYESSQDGVSVLNVVPKDINTTHANVLHFTITPEGLAQPKLQTADHQTSSYLSQQCNLTVSSDLIGS